MKKIAILATVLVLFTACNKEETISPVKSGTKLTATLGVGTKTSLDGLQVNWTEGDEMFIYDGSAHLFTADAGGSSVSITGDKLSESGTYYGFYPYKEDQTVSNGVFSSQILINQSLASASDNWDKNAPLMIGSCEAGAEIIPFYNAHSLVGFTLPWPASTITVFSDSFISGDVNVSEAQGNVSITTTNGSHYMSLAGNMGASTYYLAAIPNNSMNDLIVLIDYTQQGLYYYTLANQVSSTLKFSLNEIAKFNMANANGQHLDPATGFKQPGHYLFLTPTGGSIIIKGDNNAAMKWADMDVDIYWEDDETIVNWAGNTNQQGNGAFSVPVSNGRATIKINSPKIGGTPGQPNSGTSQSGNDFYLTLSSNHNGAFKIVRGSGNATNFYVYTWDAN